MTTPTPSDPTFDEITVNAYNSVFSVNGDLQVMSVSPPVLYIKNRILSMLSCANFQNNILLCARNLTDSQLMQVLFKAVAGDYTIGNGALQQQTCVIKADPTTGYLSIQDKTQENRALLTIIIIILFVTLGWILYRPFWMKQQQETASTVSTTQTSTTVASKK